MACESIILNRVDMPKMHPKLTAAALAELGARDVSAYGFTLAGVRYAFQGGQLVSAYVDAAELGRVADLVKRSYSAQAVKYAAARNGWAVRQVAPFQYEVIK